MPHVVQVSQWSAQQDIGCAFPTTPNQPFYNTTTWSLTTCYVLGVRDCPYQGSSSVGIHDIEAAVAVTNVPTGTTSKGLIILLSGDGGTNFFNFPHGGDTGVAGESYAGDYYHSGVNPSYTVAQVAWLSRWNDNSNDPPIKSLVDEACRPYYLMKYINDNFSQAGPTCAQGHSGGASEIAYSLAFYGADRHSGGYLDTVLFTSGPPESDIKAGCQYPQSGGGPPINVCSGSKCVGAISSWPDCLQYPNGNNDCNNPYNTYENTQTYQTAQAVSHDTIGYPSSSANNCNNYTGTGTSTSAYDLTWADMSLVTGTTAHGNASYPNTFVYAYLCTGPHLIDQDPLVDGSSGYINLSNDSAAQGWSYLNLVSTSTGQLGGVPQIYGVDYCADPEMIWVTGAVALGTGGVAAFTRSEQDMANNCQNPH